MSLALCAVLLGATGVAAAQTAVPPTGEGTVSLTYESYHHTGHFDKFGHKNTNGATQSQVVVTQIDLGIGRAFGLNVTLPFIASKYTGTPSYLVEGNVTTPGPLDNGTYHGAFQDLRVEMRRMFGAGPVVMSPFISGAVPTHAYETVGEAVPGRNRRELQLGVSAGAELDRFLPGTQFHGRYAYSALQRVNGLPHTRSNIDLEVGHDLSARIGLQALTSWQIAHKRPTIAELLPDWIHHDRFINSSSLSVGGSGSFSVNRSIELFVTFAATVRGDHGAHVARVLAIGVNRSFGGGFKGLGG